MPPDNLDESDVQEPVKVRCYCGNVGRMIEDKLICRQCIAKGRDGAPWPGDYYQKTGLFRDRGNEFNPSSRKFIAGGSNRTSAIPPRAVTTQEVDSRTEMYGNLILKQRVDLAELCDLYNLKNMVIVGGDNQFISSILERSDNISLFLVGDREPQSNDQQPFVRTTLVALPSVIAADNITERVDAVFLTESGDEYETDINLHVWFSKLRKGGILAGSGYRTLQIKTIVQKFTKQHQMDTHLIYEKSEDGTQVNDICYYIWKRN